MNRQRQEQPIPTQTMTMTAALNSALDLALAEDDKVLLLGEDIADPMGGVFKVTKGLSTKFTTRRVRSTPISEQAIVGAAVGAALAGYRPVAEIMFFDFTAVCMDQIVNHAAKLRYMSGGQTPVPMTLRTMVGQQRFGAQHAQSLEAWFMHVPGLKVVVPSTPLDAKGLLYASVFDDDPCVFIENSNLSFTQKQEVPIGEVRIELGRAAIKRPGNDVTVITYGAAVHTALDAAESLENLGISAEIVDLRTLVPLDIETLLASVERTRRAVVVHDAVQFCGAGAEIAAQLNEQLFCELLAPVLRVGAPHTPPPFGPSGLGFVPTPGEVVVAVRDLVDPIPA